MKKRFLINLLLISILTLPISSYAEEITIPQSVNSEYTANITLKYIQNDQKELDSSPSIGCKAAYVAEPKTGKVLYEKNAHEKMYPASTTKILTALVVLENCDLTKEAVVSQNALDLVPDRLFICKS